MSSTQTKALDRWHTLVQLFNQANLIGFIFPNLSSRRGRIAVHATGAKKQLGRVLKASVVATTLVMLAGCQESASPDAATTVQRVRMSDPAQVVRGQALFAQHSAVCHGAQAQGDANWRQRDPDGKFPPPPLNGTGHAWHHPYGWLKEMIRNGSAPQGNMPAWGSTLDDQQIEDLIAWFQSLWPDEVYAAWYEMEQRRQVPARY